MLKTRIWSLVAAALTALVLSACGGGAEFGGTTGGTLGGTTGGDPGDPVPAKLILLSSSPQLTSDASSVDAGVTLTAIVRDANNNVVPGVTVVFSTQDSAEINVVNPAITDQNGRVSAVLTTGGDPTNRPIRVRAATQTLSEQVTVQIVGTQLDISGPDTTQFNTPTEYTVLLTDGANRGVAGQTIALQTEPENTLSASSLVTNVSGQVTVNFSAQRANSTLTASALGLNAVQPITASPDQFVFIASSTAPCPPQTGTAPTLPAEANIGVDREVTICWVQNDQPVNNRNVNFAATRGSFPEGATRTTAGGRATVKVRSPEAGLSTITASSQDLTRPSASSTVEFVATTPARIDVQASPSTVPPNQTSEITAVVRDANNNLVKNVTVEFALSDLTTGTLSAPTAVTNSQGLARVNYSSTSQTSATEGVTVTARVRNTNIADRALLTVGGRAVSIFLGTGSEILIKDESTYQMTYTVVVSDSAGNPVPDAQFRLTLAPTRYFEGFFDDLRPQNGCPNEDVNLNDILDETYIDGGGSGGLPGCNDPSRLSTEDRNCSGRLEPGRVAVLPATITLDSDGAGQFLVTYPKDVGSFVEVEITGTATVAGSETTVKRRFLLPIAEDDVDNLPGVSPYGVDGNCATADLFDIPPLEP